MNKLHIYTTEPLLKWIKDMPEEPKWHEIPGTPDSSDYEIRDEQRNEYEQALSKAKREAKTPFEDQKFVSFLIRTNPIGTELIPDKIYSIDYNGRVEIINSRFAKDDLPVGIPVARLIPESTEVKRVIAFDGNTWMKEGDVGDNSKFWKSATVIREREVNGEMLVDVLFDDGQVSNGHFKNTLKQIPIESTEVESQEESFTRRELEIAYCTGLLNQKDFTMEDLEIQLGSAKLKIEKLIELIHNIRNNGHSKD
jgi:hypothetical protein